MLRCSSVSDGNDNFSGWLIFTSLESLLAASVDDKDGSCCCWDNCNDSNAEEGSEGV